MPQELIQLDPRKPLIRILLIVLLLAAAVWSYFAVRWYIGNTLAEYFNAAGNNLQVAQMAVSMAPNDPLTHWRMGQASQKLLPLDQQAQAIVEFERAVSLSPNDYRFWMALGTAREQAGDRVKAEQALRQAVALAPAYAYPHWYLGNLLLRSGSYEEAFAALRRASEADLELQPQQFNLVWEIYGSDTEALEKAVGDSSFVRARFALYLIDRKEFEDGLRLWRGIGSEERKANRESGEAMVASLINALRYHEAVKVWNDIAPSDQFRAEVGQIFDGGFEEAGSYGPEVPFAWQVRQVPQLQVGADPSKGNNGARSLRLVFHVRTNLDTVNVSQMVPVAANTEYDFEYYVSTERLETGSPPLVQILDAATSAVLATSAPAPNGSNGWNRVGLQFKTGEKTEAVTLKIIRPSCGTQEVPVCPIFGSVWYDDFSFKRRG